MSQRQTFSTRKFRLVGEFQRALAAAAVLNMPIDPESPLEVRIGEETKIRGLDANARMWVGPLKDIAEQAWVNGQQFKDIVWHEYFKIEYLPDDDDPDLAELAKEGYRKWAYMPNGRRGLIGSTTQLTKRGFALYTMKIEAYGAGLGVQFSAGTHEH